MDQLGVSMNNLKELNELDDKHVVLDGDLPDIEWSAPQYARSISEKMLDTVDDYNLKQMVHEPTRLENTLDLVFSTLPDLIENTYVVPGMSEHSAVICDINFKLTPPALPPPFSSRELFLSIKRLTWKASNKIWSIPSIRF